MHRRLPYLGVHPPLRKKYFYGSGVQVFDPRSVLASPPLLMTAWMDDKSTLPLSLLGGAAARSTQTEVTPRK